jgi:signal transduction histidine kinase
VKLLEQLQMNEPLVLVVDDDEQSLLVIKSYLEQMGIRTHATNKSNEVIELLGSLHPSTLILDIIMPDPDGFKLCKMVKQSSEYSTIPVVLLSCIDDVENKILEGIPSSLPDAILTKPVNKARLKITISAMLRMWEQYQKMSQGVEEVKGMENMRDNLINMLAHDMRHPLQAIYGYCSFLDGTLPSPISHPALAQQIKNHAYRLNQMLQNFLDVGRLENNKLPLFWEEFTLGDCLGQCVERMANLAQFSEIKLKIFCDEEGFKMEADSMLISRILDNLVNNAIKFSKKGQEITISASTDSSGEHVFISVKDNGPGIEDKHKQRIFEKFGASDLFLHNKPSVGLGLAFSKLAAKAHEGDIWVEDNPEGGSIFKLSIPSRRAVQRAQSNTQSHGIVDKEKE